MDDTKANKTVLSHTVSLPVASSGAPPPLIPGRNKNRSPSGSNDSTATGSPSNSSGGDKKSAGKSWSFGTMAKAVGSGVSAFGSGVVNTGVAVGTGVYQGSKAVGTGVVQGTKVVGTGVVQGTMVAGRVTKDVTLAAGKNVVQAGEIVGSAAVTGVSVIGNTTVQAGKDLTNASVSAVQDTTKWVISRTESLLGECTVHVVLPDETLDDICSQHSVTPHIIIRANNLTTRRLRVGKEIMVPNPTDFDTVLHLQHDMSTLEVAGLWACNEPAEDDAAAAAENPSDQAELTHGRLKFTCDEVCFLPSEKNLRQSSKSNTSSSSSSSDSDSDDSSASDSGVQCFNVESAEIRLCLNLPSDPYVSTNSTIPDLVPAHLIEERQNQHFDDADDLAAADKVLNDGSRQSGGSATLVVEVEELLRQRHQAQEEEAAHLASLPQSQLLTLRVKREDATLVRFLCDPSHLDQVLAHIDLWYPELLEQRPLYRVKRGGQDQDLDLDEGLTLEMTARSEILSSRHLLLLHSRLPAKTQSDRWHLVFSSHYDGYSLQNFYRKVAETDEPVLLVFNDDEGHIFGAYLTCVPQICEGFIGTGKSWLYSFTGSTSNNSTGDDHVDDMNPEESGQQSPPQLSVFPWSGTNDYFFQGRVNGFVIGAADGNFGIYMDEDFNKGRLQACDTFTDWPHEERDFTLKYFECWNYAE